MKKIIKRICLGLLIFIVVVVSALCVFLFTGGEKPTVFIPTVTDASGTAYGVVEGDDGETMIVVTDKNGDRYAAHTNADKVAAGVSGAMAARLCLKDVEILDQDGEGTGLGVVGNLPEPMPASEFVYYVKKAFGLSSVRCSHLPEGEISRVAMCGGSGSSLIGKARSSGAQAYVSGDITYHHFFTPEDFLIVDIGHFEGEVDIVNILFSLIKKKFPTFAVRTSSGLAAGNPVLYF